MDPDPEQFFYIPLTIGHGKRYRAFAPGMRIVWLTCDTLSNLSRWLRHENDRGISFIGPDLVANRPQWRAGIRLRRPTNTDGRGMYATRFTSYAHTGQTCDHGRQKHAGAVSWPASAPQTSVR
jgi:hypothetical protein